MGMTVHLKRGELAWGWRLSRTHEAPWTPTCTGRHIFLLWFLLFSRSVRFNSLWPHGLQHTRVPCPSPFPGVWSNSCPLSRWCHPTISSSVIPFTSCLQSFPASGSFPSSSFFFSKVFSSELVLQIRWPKYWSFSFSIIPSKERPGLISFRMDWLDLLAVQGTPNSLLQHHSSKASILQYAAFFTVQGKNEISLSFI